MTNLKKVFFEWTNESKTAQPNAVLIIGIIVYNVVMELQPYSTTIGRSFIQCDIQWHRK